MRDYDPNASLSVFAVVIGGVLGLALGFVLGFGGVGVVLLMIVGILTASLLASALGVVGERGGRRPPEDDLPPEYYDY
ncbi:MAG: hypothetical protein H0V81_03215 [Solirubrobacterales bacterium]|nr:hypothetical protein [Solirubrobacterales bacterium]